MSIFRKIALPLSLALGLAVGLTSTVDAATCKGTAQSKCEKSDSCSWVNGYKTKSGNTVKGYCRNKAKSSSTSKDKKSKDSKSK